MSSTNSTGQRRYPTIGWSKFARLNAANSSGKTTTSAMASPAPAMAHTVKKRESRLSEMRPRFEGRLQACIGAPQRDAEPHEKAKGQPALARRRDAADLLAANVDHA